MTNNNIVFRNKFEKVVNEQNRDELQMAFQQFCDLKPEKAVYLLWRLGTASNSVKDGTDEALKYAAHFLTNFGLDTEVIELENLDLLRSELRYQYEQKNPNFLHVDAWDESCKSAYEELKNKTDSIIAYVVYTRCVERVYIMGVERILHLLSSEEEKNFFGGIRSLNFSWHEANYLKHCHEQLYELLNALHEHRVKEDAEIRKNNPLALPMVSLSEEIFGVCANEEEENEEAKAKPVVAETKEQQAVDTASEELSAEKSTETTDDERQVQLLAYVPLTVEVVLEHQELFRAFLNSDMNVLLKIGNLGLDLNEVMAKKEKISALLIAIDDFAK